VKIVIRLPMSDLAEGERALDAGQVRYVSRVHRLHVGDRFVAFDPTNAVECDAEILSARRVRLGKCRPSATTAMREITWVHGCPKGDKADAIVRDATELGATRIVFVPTTRSVARPSPTRVERWVRIAREAARQCNRGDAPEVILAPTWEEALQGIDAETRVCLDPRGEPLHAVLSRATGALAFAAGPEGGFTEAELDAARTRNFVLCRLGSFVMRTETAPAAVLGAVALLAP
jgi:16S rRNA (uracil1498-N3)-methyltransferase